jgi:hypothetical protein
VSPGLYLLAWIGRVGVIVAWLALIPLAASLVLRAAGLHHNRYWTLFAGNLILSVVGLLLFRYI